METLDKSIQRTVRWIFVILIVLGLATCIGSYYFSSISDSEFNSLSWFGGLLLNFGTEMFGALATFILFEIVLRNQEKRREATQLKASKQHEEQQRRREKWQEEQTAKREQARRDRQQQQIQKSGEKRSAVFTLLSDEIKDAKAFRTEVRKDIDKLQKELTDIKKKLSK